MASTAYYKYPDYAAAIFQGKDKSRLDLLKQSSCNDVYSGLLRSRGRIVNSAESADLVFWLIDKIVGDTYCLSEPGEHKVLAEVFNKFPGAASRFYEAAQLKSFGLPAPVIKWLGKKGMITPERFLLTKPTDKEAVYELARQLGSDPSQDMFDHVALMFKDRFTDNKRVSQRINEILNQKVVSPQIRETLALFELLPHKCFAWIRNRFAWNESTLMALIQSKKATHEVKAEALCDVLPYISNNPHNMFLASDFEIPAAVMGESLLRVLGSLSLLNSGKQYIKGLPSKDDMAVRMLVLLLDPKTRDSKKVEEANKIRDELARTIAAVQKAIAQKSVAGTSKKAKKAA